jgi:methionine-S-sulfoxide reductase
MKIQKLISMILLLAITALNHSVVRADTEKATAILAGGCFWCIESDFEKLDGVYEAVSGYTGGHVDNPGYKQVSAGNTGHIESAIISYDPAKLNYKQILEYFFHHIDPTNDKGQFCDYGSQYRPAIFYQDEAQRKIAEDTLLEISQNKPFADPIKVELIKASTFYPAEDYHQDYYKKNPIRYTYYRFSCGRDARVEALWGKSE